MGERQLDTYREVLAWIRRIEKNTQISNFLELMEMLILPEKLELNVTAFASSEVRHRMDTFVGAWLAMQRRLQDDEERIGALIREAWKTKDFTILFAAEPEWNIAFEAMAALRNSIRIELLGDVAGERSTQVWPVTPQL
jgi:hypothetical protein